jgi:hypothetical protein
MLGVIDSSSDLICSAGTPEKAHSSAMRDKMQPLQSLFLSFQNIPATESEQILIEPSDSLQESLFLGILLLLFACVATNCKTVNHAAVKVDLIWLFGFEQDSLGFVALLGGKYLVCLGGCDGEGASNSGKFVFFDET